MTEFSPCLMQAQALHYFIVTMNVFQAIAIAWLTRRAIGRDSAERKRNGVESGRQ